MLNSLANRWHFFNCQRFAFLLIAFSCNCGQLVAEENLFLPEEVQQSDWSFVRGSSYDGHSPEVNIADSWPEEGPPVLWTRELGQGYSAFVAAGDRVYTQGQTLGRQYVYCLDADSGETIWSHKYEWAYEGMGVYPGPRSTPTISGNRLFFAAPSGLVRCLNAETGKLIWSRNVLVDFKGEGGDGFGYACSPVVVEGMVILPVGGKSASIVALDVKNGSEIWSEGDSPASYAPAYPIERNGRKLVVGYLQNSIVIHDRKTGKLLRELDLSQGYDEHSCWPIYKEPYLWTASPFRSGSQLYEIPEDLDSDEELKLTWTSKTMSNDVLSSVLVDDHIYGFDIFDVQSKTQRPSRGMFRCIEFMSGTEKWSQGTGNPRRGGKKDDPNEIGQSGIVAVDGKLILLNERGELILLKANPEKLEVLARTSLLGGELTWTPPILHRGRLYVRNHSRAVCVYVGEPELLRTKQVTLAITDLPQREYQNWASIILPIEPEYMFDVPSVQWMKNWYAASIAILCVAGVCGFFCSLPFPKQRNLIQKWCYVAIAFVLAALGTTLLSSNTQAFYFTWPVCLFVAYEPVIASIRKRKPTEKTEQSIWAGRAALLFFAATCLVYFLLCRRLSLVFEWAYLIGFVGATPFLLLKKIVPDTAIMRLTAIPILTLLAFTGFYICGVLPLIVGY